MTDKTRHRIEYGLLAIIFGAGAGWGAYQIQLRELDSRLSRIEERVTAIYCLQVPEHIRGACQ